MQFILYAGESGEIEGVAFLRYTYIYIYIFFFCQHFIITEQPMQREPPNLQHLFNKLAYVASGKAGLHCQYRGSNQLRKMCVCVCVCVCAESRSPYLSFHALSPLIR